MKTKTTLGLLACLLVVGIAYATITFDSLTGAGFVGKGDVQTALAWNNAQLQANAATVKFTYVSKATYEITEVFATGNPDRPWSLDTHTQTQTTTSSIAGTVNGDPRKEKGQSQFTGFNLWGYNGQPSTTGGALPTVDTVFYVTYTWTDNQGDSHTTENMPVDENGDLYTEGGHKAVASVTLVKSEGGLYANGVLLATP